MISFIIDYLERFQSSLFACPIVHWTGDDIPSDIRVHKISWEAARHIHNENKKKRNEREKKDWKRKKMWMRQGSTSKDWSGRSECHDDRWENCQLIVDTPCLIDIATLHTHMYTQKYWNKSTNLLTKCPFSFSLFPHIFFSFLSLQRTWNVHWRQQQPIPNPIASMCTLKPSPFSSSGMSGIVTTGSCPSLSLSARRGGASTGGIGWVCVSR